MSLVSDSEFIFWGGVLWPGIKTFGEWKSEDMYKKQLKLR